MKHVSVKVSGGFLSAALAVAVPARAMAAFTPAVREAESPQIQAVIKEWLWRNMSL